MECYLPVLSHFQNGNVWTGSDGRLRYRLAPGEEAITAQVWEGPWAYELSPMEDAAQFPLSQEGLEALAGWLQTWGAQINARPARTLEEDLRRRADFLAAQAVRQAQ